MKNGFALCPVCSVRVSRTRSPRGKTSRCGVNSRAQNPVTLVSSVVPFGRVRVANARASISTGSAPVFATSHQRSMMS